MKWFVPNWQTKAFNKLTHEGALWSFLKENVAELESPVDKVDKKLEH